MTQTTDATDLYPKPRRDNTVRGAHGHTYADPYAWMRDDERDSDEVLAHLNAENDYTTSSFAARQGLVESLFTEIRSRIKLDNESVPTFRRGWWYWRSTSEATQYPTHLRSRSRDKSNPQVVLDENQLAEGHEFCDLIAAEVSPDGGKVAYIIDYAGNELGEIHIRDIESGQDHSDTVTDVESTLAWNATSDALLYVKSDEARRPCQVWLHRLSTDQSSDTQVFVDSDPRYYIGVSTLKGEQLLAIACESKESSEWMLLDANDLSKPPVSVRPRHDGVEYSIDYDRDRQRLLILHNITAEDFSLQFAEVDLETLQVSPEWHDFVTPDPDVRIDDFEIFTNHLAMIRRHHAQTDICVRNLTTGAETVLDFGEPYVTVGGGVNPDSSASTMRLSATSMTMPASTYDYHLATGELELLKRAEVLGGYDPAAYTVTRHWATADNGVQVPMTLIYSNDTALNGSAPALVYAYGAYEISMDTWFSPSRLSLLDRGAIFVVVHARGGGELGRKWYRQGKFSDKPNTFDDVIACTKFLIDQAIVDQSRVSLRGGSAGGLMVGATINRAPELFCSVVSEVGFVDCLTTMCDPTIPLTTAEYEEWGNPTDDEGAYRDILGYSPINNITATKYPIVFATAGLHDPRVGYWEPAKWVATLRDTVTNPSDIYLQVELAGHGGPSERDKGLREEAQVLAFLLDSWGITA